MGAGGPRLGRFPEALLAVVDIGLGLSKAKFTIPPWRYSWRGQVRAAARRPDECVFLFVMSNGQRALCETGGRCLCAHRRV